MLTIFTIPKPFIGHIDIIQKNAIQSWLELDKDCEIILCGNEVGVAETAHKLKISHISEIERNEYGTPLIRSAFSNVERASKFDLLCYANTDIIFFPDMPSVLSTIPFSKFMVVGQRWNLDIIAVIDFSDPNWSSVLRDEVEIDAVISKPLGSDYFIFKKNSLGDLPDFTVGRPAWDNWMIFHARSLRIPVIDGSQKILDVHQNHDYLHVPDGANNSWEGPEAERNRQLYGNGHLFDLFDSTHLIDSTGAVMPVEGDQYIKRKIQRLVVLKSKSQFSYPFIKFIQRILFAMYYRRHNIPNGLLNGFVNLVS